MKVDQSIESDDKDDDIIEGELSTEAEDNESEDPVESEAEDGENSDESEEESGEVVITIGDSPAPEDDDSEEEEAPQWVKDLRKTHKETLKQNRELQKKIKQLEKPTAAPTVPKPGAKPKLVDHGYDSEKFEEALDKWYKANKAYEDEIAKQEEEQNKEKESWNNKLQGYETAKLAMSAKVKDFDSAEAEVLANFSQVQQGIMIKGAKDPALLFFAIGTNETKLKELSSIKDPVDFAFAVSKLEETINMTTRKGKKSPPPPEKSPSSGGSTSGSVDSELERLRAEAAKTGNYSKVAEYKRKKKAAASK